MKVDVIRHGDRFFQNKEIKCPECNFVAWKECHQVNGTGTVSKPASGVYEFTCYYCGAIYQIITEE